MNANQKSIEEILKDPQSPSQIMEKIIGMRTTTDRNKN